ncbi:MAG: hypothetical protein Q4F57_04820 [Weeksellaceae bacterium]|nr:hypothetical protein [Weeksellaceae bacterium]
MRQIIGIFFLCGFSIFSCSGPESQYTAGEIVNTHNNRTSVEVEGMLSIEGDLAEFLPCDANESWFLRDPGSELRKRYTELLSNKVPPFAMVQARLVLTPLETVAHKSEWESLYDKVYEVVEVKSVVPHNEQSIQCKNQFYELEAIGNEPGWTLLLNQLEDQKYSYKMVSDYGENNYLGIIHLTEGYLQKKLNFSGNMPDGSPLSIVVIKENCTDDAGNAMPAAITVQYKNRELIGCVRKIEL